MSDHEECLELRDYLIARIAELEAWGNDMEAQRDDWFAENQRLREAVDEPCWKCHASRLSPRRNQPMSSADRADEKARDLIEANARIAELEAYQANARRLAVQAVARIAELEGGWRLDRKAQRARIAELEAIVRDLPDHSDLDAAAFRVNQLEAENQRLREALELARKMDGWYDDTNHTHREFKAALAALTPTEEPASCPDNCALKGTGTPHSRHVATTDQDDEYGPDIDWSKVPKLTTDQDTATVREWFPERSDDPYAHEAHAALDRLTARIEDANAAVDREHDTVEELTAECVRQHEAIEDLTAERKRLTARIADLEADQADAEQVVSKAWGAYENARSRIVELEKEVHNLLSYDTFDRANYEARIAELEDTLRYAQGGQYPFVMAENQRLRIDIAWCVGQMKERDGTLPKFLERYAALPTEEPAETYATDEPDLLRPYGDDPGPVEFDNAVSRRGKVREEPHD